MPCRISYNQSLKDWSVSDQENWVRSVFDPVVNGYSSHVLCILFSESSENILIFLLLKINRHNSLFLSIVYFQLAGIFPQALASKGTGEIDNRWQEFCQCHLKAIMALISVTVFQDQSSEFICHTLQTWKLRFVLYLTHCCCC